MAEPAPVPQESPAPPEAPEPPEPQGFPWIRVLAGVMLAAIAVAAAVWFSRPAELELSVRLEPLAPRAGERARLFLKVSPGPALGGAPLQKVRARVEPPADLVFERKAEQLLPGEQEMVLGFTVDKRAALGPRRVAVLISAELPAPEGRGAARAVGLHRQVDVWVTAGGAAGQ